MTSDETEFNADNGLTNREREGKSGADALTARARGLFCLCTLLLLCIFWLGADRLRFVPHQEQHGLEKEIENRSVDLLLVQ